MRVSMRQNIKGYRYQCECGQHGGLMAHREDGQVHFRLLDDGGWAGLRQATARMFTHITSVHGGQAEAVMGMLV